ncbi:hypothetical protein DFJ74DRAFT_705667 [Hyaloraphidium curvatum]|nr:hypothetical protein DFJ74DRAFT_705667 [Hyaloraphidium curvatum]
MADSVPSPPRIADLALGSPRRSEKRPSGLRRRGQKTPSAPSPAPDDGGEEMPTDPALAFPIEVFLHMLTFLATPPALATCSRVSRAWHVASNDGRLWSFVTRNLWSDKTYVPQRFRDMLEAGDPKEAYKLSLEDSTRDTITAEEMCSFTWQWRFKEVAGPHFTDDDPWFRGLPPRERKYHPDGRVTGPYAMNDTRWRFVRSAEGRVGEIGRFIRVWNTPAAVVGRHSKHWGFFLQSCWHLSTAFPLPKRGEDPEMDDENLAVTTQTQKYEVLCYNTGIEWDDNEVMDRRGFERAVRRAGWDINGLRQAGWDSDDDLASDDEDEDEEEGEGEGEEGQEIEYAYEWVTDSSFNGEEADGEEGDGSQDGEDSEEGSDAGDESAGGAADGDEGSKGDIASGDEAVVAEGGVDGDGKSDADD